MPKRRKATTKVTDPKTDLHLLRKLMEIDLARFRDLNPTASGVDAILAGSNPVPIYRNETDGAVIFGVQDYLLGVGAHATFLTLSKKQGGNQVVLTDRTQILKFVLMPGEDVWWFTCDGAECEVRWTVSLPLNENDYGR